MIQRADHARAGKTAQKLRDLAPKDATNLYNVACCYSLCAGALVKDKGADQLTSEELAFQERYTEAALESLRQAIELGFRDAAHMQSDSDLDPIREHPAYRKLEEELKGKGQQ